MACLSVLHIFIITWICLSINHVCLGGKSEVDAISSSTKATKRPKSQEFVPTDSEEEGIEPMISKPRDKKSGERGGGNGGDAISSAPAKKVSKKSDPSLKGTAQSESEGEEMELKISRPLGGKSEKSG